MPTGTGTSPPQLSRPPNTVTDVKKLVPTVDSHIRRWNPRVGQKDSYEEVCLLFTIMGSGSLVVGRAIAIDSDRPKAAHDEPPGLAGPLPRCVNLCISTRLPSISPIQLPTISRI